MKVVETYSYISNNEARQQKTNGIVRTVSKQTNERKTKLNKSNFKNEPIKLCTLDEACERYRLGRTKMREIAKENNAIRHFGKCARFDIDIMDKAIRNY